MMKRYIIVLLALSVLSGCARKTTDIYKGHDREEYNGRVLVDSVVLDRLLAENRNTTTNRLDSIIIRDSVRIVEHADGTTETYRERNAERFNQFATLDQINTLLSAYESRNRHERDTTYISVKDTTYIYKEKGISKAQRFVNYVGVIGSIVVVLLISIAIIWKLRR